MDAVFFHCYNYSLIKNNRFYREPTMKKFGFTFTATLAFAALFFLQTNVFAQTNQSSEWIRVRSDDGEFSVEVPADYKFIVDKTGFQVNDTYNNYQLEEVKMFNSYREKTLIAFESYKAGKKALDAIRESDNRNGKSSEIERGEKRFSGQAEFQSFEQAEFRDRTVF